MPTDVEAANPVVAIEGMKYETGWTLKKNLEMFMGKKITVTLDSGTQISGKVKAIGNNLLHLEKLQGRGFSDALIQIDQISAMECQFRAYQSDLERLKKQ